MDDLSEEVKMAMFAADTDGNGVLDILEGDSSSESGDFSTGTLLLIVLIVAAVALFMTRMNRGGGEIGSIDERHL